MRKKGFTLVHLLAIMLVLLVVAGFVVPIVIPKLTKPKSEKEVTATEKSYDWSYPFPSAEEFGESDSYSMVWIGEASWIKKRFLLVRTKELHKDYGHLPYLLKAVPDVERRGYAIISKEFIATDPRSLGRIDSLLLEVRPPENTEEDIGKRHP